MKTMTVLITGSSSGIGRETAYAFARAGNNVILTYHLGRGRGQAAERKCRTLGAPRTRLLGLDVRHEASVRSAARNVSRTFGRIDFLINNAGVGKFELFKKQGLIDLERQVRTNLEGLMRMTRHFLPLVRAGVINIASAAGEEAYAEMTIYCGTKFGVRGFTQALALEYPKLRIFCVNPDQTATRLSGYVGRPASQVAEVVYRSAAGEIKVKRGGDVDVWEALRRRPARRTKALE